MSSSTSARTVHQRLRSLALRNGRRRSACSRHWLFAAGQFLLQGFARNALRFERLPLLLQIVGDLVEPILFRARQIDRIDRQDASEHGARADDDQQPVDAPAKRALESAVGIGHGRGRRRS